MGRAQPLEMGPEPRAALGVPILKPHRRGGRIEDGMVDLAVEWRPGMERERSMVEFRSSRRDESLRMLEFELDRCAELGRGCIGSEPPACHLSMTRSLMGYSV